MEEIDEEEQTDVNISIYKRKMISTFLSSHELFQSIHIILFSLCG